MSTTTDVHAIFSPMVRAAIAASGKPNAENMPSVKLGNVEFWLDGDSLAYSIPTSQWDAKALSDDLAKAISPVVAAPADPREQLIQAAGYTIQSAGVNSWIALSPGEKTMVHFDDYHNYLGFFSTKESLLNELEDRVVHSTLSYHAVHEVHWDMLPLDKKLDLVREYALTEKKRAGEMRDEFLGKIYTTLMNNHSWQAEHLLEHLDEDLMREAVYHALGMDSLPLPARLNFSSYRTALSVYLAASLQVTLQTEANQMGTSYVRGLLNADMIGKAIDQFNDGELSILAQERAIKMFGYTIARSDYHGYYYELDNDFASEDYPSQEDAIRAAYADLMAPADVRESRQQVEVCAP